MGGWKVSDAPEDAGVIYEELDQHYARFSKLFFDSFGAGLTIDSNQLEHFPT
jgi:hypothetical protein